MNQSEINGAEFSGAPVSNVITRVATALARAIVSGASIVYRGFSATVESSSSITSVLRNQYNGLLLLAATIAEQTDLQANALRIRLSNAVISIASTISANLIKLYVIAAVVQGNAAQILANLVNQFNGLIVFTSQIAVSTTVNARVTLLKLLRSAVSGANAVIIVLLKALRNTKAVVTNAEAQIIAILQDQFNGIRYGASEIVQQSTVTAKAIGLSLTTTLINSSASIITSVYVVKKFAGAVIHNSGITGIAIAIRRSAIIITYTTLQTSRLAAINLVKTIVQYITGIVGNIKSNNAAATVISSATNVTASLEATQDVPASPENTFKVPADDVQYEVEE